MSTALKQKQETKDNSGANRLRWDIVSAARKVIESRDRNPDNATFHGARYKLYDIAAQDVGKQTYKELFEDSEIRALASKVFPISCEAGIHEECAIAEQLLTKPELTFGHVYRNYYGHIYEILMNDELAFLQAQDDINIQDERVVYIGGGALPIPAMLLAQKTGCKVTVLDPDAPSCGFARRLIKHVGLDHLVRVTQVKGEHHDYAEADIVFMANWIPEKMAIFKRLAEFENIKYCIFRSAAEQSLSFVINDSIQLCDVCSCGFELKHKTRKHPDLSLSSLVLTAKTKTDVACFFKKQEAKKSPQRVVDNMTDLIGNTPMLRLDPCKTGLRNIQLYAKLEHLNPFGSIKDRTAWGMLKPHIESIKDQNKTVLEISSGNAARGLQAIASIYGTKLETISNRIRVDEMRNMLLMQGTKVTPLPADQSKDAYDALKTVDRHAADNPDKYFYTDQYRNPNNDGTHYSETGREILEDLGNVDIFAGAVGTAGSTMGISRRLRERNPDLKVIGVISEKDDFIPGIRHKDEIFNIGAFDEKSYETISAITTNAAIDGILELVRLYGVMAGPSSGATYQAVLTYLKEIDKDLTEPKTAVFVICDRMEMYGSWISERRPELFEI